MGRPSDEFCVTVAAKLERISCTRSARQRASSLRCSSISGSPHSSRRRCPLLSVSEPVVRTAEQLGGDALIARNDNYGPRGRKRRQPNPRGSAADRVRVCLAQRNRRMDPKLRTEFFAGSRARANWKEADRVSAVHPEHPHRGAGQRPRQDRARCADALSKPPPPTFAAPAITPKGPGRAYTVQDALALLRRN